MYHEYGRLLQILCFCVFCYSFDMVHSGHANFLRQAKALGDYLLSLECIQMVCN